MLTMIALYFSYVTLRLYFLPSLPTPSTLVKSYSSAFLAGSLEFLTLAAFVLASLLPPLYLVGNHAALQFYTHPPRVLGVPVSGLITGLGR